MEAKLKQLENCVKGVQKRVDALQSELWFRKYGVTGCSLLTYFRTHSYTKDGDTQITRSGRKTHNCCLWVVTGMSGLCTLQDVIGIISNDPEFAKIRSMIEQTNNDRLFADLSQLELSAKFSQHKTCLHSTRRRMSLVSQVFEQERHHGHVARFQNYFKTRSVLKATAWAIDAENDTSGQTVSIYQSKHREDEWKISIVGRCSEFVHRYSLDDITDLLFQVTDTYDFFCDYADDFGCCMRMAQKCLNDMIKQLDT
jgi:hypothetical protein